MGTLDLSESRREVLHLFVAQVAVHFIKRRHGVLAELVGRHLLYCTRT